jgi:hypothetical protein
VTDQLRRQNVPSRLIDFPALAVGTLLETVPGTTPQLTFPFGAASWKNIKTRITEITPDRLSWYEWGTFRPVFPLMGLWNLFNPDVKFEATVTVRRVSDTQAEVIVNPRYYGWSMGPVRTLTNIVAAERNRLVLRPVEGGEASVTEALPNGKIQMLISAKGVRIEKQVRITGQLT